MKLYVSADMEGTAAICAWNQVNPADTNEYPVYRRYMTREVAAAIEGARDAGATEFLVNDAHWDMRNLLWDELPSDVRMISGARKPFSMVEGAHGYDAAFFTGYHARIGQRGSVLAHTYSDDSLYDIHVNGTPCSEALLNAALLGQSGIPVILVTGDHVVVESTKAAMPWVTGVVVKESIGYFAANSLTPPAACDAIRAGAREAVASLPHAKPFRFEPPIEMIVEAAKTEQADLMELLPHIERIGGRTIRYRHDDYATVFHMMLAVMRIGYAANLPA
jgi:D-amino peptidase